MKQNGVRGEWTVLLVFRNVPEFEIPWKSVKYRSYNPSFNDIPLKRMEPWKYHPKANHCMVDGWPMVVPVQTIAFSTRHFLLPITICKTERERKSWQNPAASPFVATSRLQKQPIFVGSLRSNVRSVHTQQYNCCVFYFLQSSLPILFHHTVERKNKVAQRNANESHRLNHQIDNKESNRKVERQESSLLNRTRKMV